MKPDWDLLAERVHPSVFIADVNCQVEVSLCVGFHTGGRYPTVLIFEQGKEPELYEGGRGLEDLTKFVDEHLVEPCNLHRLEETETCSEKEQKYTQKWEKRSLEDRKKELARLSSMDRETMPYELSKWLGDRVHILEQLQEAAEKEL
jgi:thioredoxin-like negative regulator of GroEL